jgi:hypothetical protein
VLNLPLVVRSRSLQLPLTLLVWAFVLAVLRLSSLHAPSPCAAHSRSQLTDLALSARPAEAAAPTSVAPTDHGAPTLALATATRLPPQLTLAQPSPRPTALPTSRIPVYLRQLALLL